MSHTCNTVDRGKHNECNKFFLYLTYAPISIFVTTDVKSVKKYLLYVSKNVRSRGAFTETMTIIGVQEFQF